MEKSESKNDLVTYSVKNARWRVNNCAFFAVEGNIRVNELFR